jgi:hypothetical protein
MFHVVKISFSKQTGHHLRIAKRNELKSPDGHKIFECNFVL